MLLALALLLMQASVAPQASLTIQGIVKDPSGALIPGVSVHLKPQPARLPRLAVTDETGSYSLGGLPPGTYEVVAELPGFLRTPRIVDLTSSLSIDFVMGVAPIPTCACISVSGPWIIEAPLPTAQEMERRSAAIRLASQLWQFPLQIETNTAQPQMELRRTAVLAEFRAFGVDAIPALNLALLDPDVLVRRNAVLILLNLSSDSQKRIERLNISAALPALMITLEDADSSVRGWSAQALGTIGAQGVRAIPALREALNDTSPDVRRLAQEAINNIEMK
jgi:HEAT repeat protein